jgi:hypothetical protein
MSLKTIGTTNQGTTTEHLSLCGGRDNAIDLNDLSTLPF